MPGARRCYGCDRAEARYEAHLDWDTTPVVLLCDACAIWERAAGSVIWIRTLHENSDGMRALDPAGLMRARRHGG